MSPEMKERIRRAQAEQTAWAERKYLLPLSKWVPRLGIQMLRSDGTVCHPNTKQKPERVMLRFFDTRITASDLDAELAMDLALAAAGQPEAGATTPVPLAPHGKQADPKFSPDYDQGDELFAGIFQLDKPIQAREIPAEQLAEHEAKMAELRRKAAEKDLPPDLPDGQ